MPWPLSSSSAISKSYRKLRLVYMPTVAAVQKLWMRGSNLRTEKQNPRVLLKQFRSYYAHNWLHYKYTACLHSQPFGLLWGESLFASSRAIRVCGGVLRPSRLYAAEAVLPEIEIVWQVAVLCHTQVLAA